MRYRNPGDPVYAPNSKGGPHADTARFGEPAGWHADGELQRAAYTLHAEDDDWGQAGHARPRRDGRRGPRPAGRQHRRAPPRRGERACAAYASSSTSATSTRPSATASKRACARYRARVKPRRPGRPHRTGTRSARRPEPPDSTTKQPIMATRSRVCAGAVRGGDRRGAGRLVVLTARRRESVAHLGTPAPTAGVDAWRLFGVEAVVTFVLVLVIVGVATGRRGLTSIAPLAIGSALTVDDRRRDVHRLVGVPDGSAHRRMARGDALHPVPPRRRRALS